MISSTATAPTASRKMRLTRAAVLGAGVMGSTIAAHLANVGIPTVLLDIVPKEPNDDERKRGLGLDAPEVRNRFARTGLERAVKAQPAAFYSPDRAALVTTGNFEDHLDLIRDADWVIEAVVEDLAIKRDLLARVEARWRPGMIVSTNTSGLPVAAVAEQSGQEFRAHFLGTHFFNPPRYMKLLELIPTPHTHAWVTEAVAGWGERLLGKGIVYAKDTPNFIANRIGTYGMLKAIHLMVDLGLEIDEVDELTGPILGRPRSATFRTGDLVGLDTLLHVASNSHRNLPDDEERGIYVPPAILTEMAKRGWLGEKTGGGFYKRQDGDILTLDYRTFEYRPRKRLSTGALEAAKSIAEPEKRVAALLAMEDKYGEFLRRLTGAVLVYAARRIPEISDDVVNVDRALRWGFGWDHGPFEQWDALAAIGAADRLLPPGEEMPEVLRQVRERGAGAWYRDGADGRTYFDLESATYLPEPGLEGRILLPHLKSRGRTVEGNAGASLVDLGDGVACLEFHSKMNAIGEDIIVMTRRALERVRSDFDALVIGNQGSDFCVGANLMLILMEAQEGNWEDLDFVVRQFQGATMELRRSVAPVVAAPFGRTLGGGVEFCLGCAHIQAAAETYMGLVEAGVGLIPAGGGTMEMTKRVAAAAPEDSSADLLPLLRKAFENIAMAKVSISGEDARRLGFLRPSDGVTVNGDLLLSDAKAAALALVRGNYRPPQPGLIRVIGSRGFAAIESLLYIMRTGGYITDHDIVVSRKLGFIMCGGDVPEGTRVSEEYLLDLEREAFLSLLGMPATLDRIRHMLQTGKPLRN
ncbi:MAG: 3-hydroxyacyl-CoA dehydrogenase/enoyl-CoA hydratase family protein [Armatimonadetes bacterium]|nr:3-hydroxyacyl-CoA dehydrogenase/enoyl-CoA hydratase family protein [Armatimonadota bacterium]